jgi:hypothetical protein
VSRKAEQIELAQLLGHLACLVQKPQRRLAVTERIRRDGERNERAAFLPASPGKSSD